MTDNFVNPSRHITKAMQSLGSCYLYSTKVASLYGFESALMLGSIHATHIITKKPGFVYQLTDETTKHIGLTYEQQLNALHQLELAGLIVVQSIKPSSFVVMINANEGGQWNNIT